jgi:catechol 2,3-dioxygenase-like lactoylglutathione lyase family enzyme
MRALALLRIGLNTRDLAAATRFYCDALGFTAVAAAHDAPLLASLLQARTVRQAWLRRGGQTLELTECDPPGADYPPDSRADDLWFQHCALPTEDMAADHARVSGHVGVTPISRHGPAELPNRIVAFKFRDPDGHPLELIQFPTPVPRTRGGIDHSALSVADADRSIAFYADRLGLTVAARDENTGPAQDALDDLDAVAVDVVALAPATAAPHVELLAYRRPRGRARPMRPTDIAASRLVFAVDALPDQGRAALLHDPDGHAVLLERGP